MERIRKRQWVLLVVISMFIIVQAQDTKTYKFWTSTPGACPITVTINGTSYQLNSGSSTFTLTLSGYPDIIAYDKYGDNMRINREAVYDGSRTHLQYVSVNIGANHWQHIPKSKGQTPSSNEPVSRVPESYQPSDDSSDDASDSDNSYGYNSNSNESIKDYAANKLGETVGDAIGTGFSNLYERGIGQESDGYPNFQIRSGISRAYGEFIGLKWCIGGESGLALYGGVGKDWLFNGDNNEKVLWHGGIGAYTSLEGDVDDLSIGITYSESAIIKETLMLDVAYSRFFGDGQKIGFFVGGGIGYGNIGSLKEGEDGKLITRDTKFVWDLKIGIAFKLWAHKMYYH